MSALQELIGSVGDDSPPEHKAIFHLAIGAQEALEQIERSHNLRRAAKTLRQRQLQASAILAHAREENADPKVTGLGYEVTITRSLADGATVIFVDGPVDDSPDKLTADGSPACRIRLNDDPVYVGTPLEVPS